MNTLVFILQQTVMFFIPLMLVALGALFSERSGVLNIALEGTMVMGAFSGLLFINAFAGVLAPQVLLLSAWLISTLCGMVYTIPHAFASINLKADQVISGTALNMFAPAFCVFTARVVQNVQQITFKNTFRIKSVPVLSRIPVIGPGVFKNTYITTFIGILILLGTVFVLKKTKFGLRLRSCGENPQAADSVGVNVYKMRYAGVMISGALAGMGGLIYVVPSTTAFSATVSGYGFLALAVLIFGQWRPFFVCFAAFFFGLMKTIAAAHSGISLFSLFDISDDTYKMIPYITTLVVLIFTSKYSKGPAVAGVPYNKGAR
jgi:simple sugar transport system permease protein